MEAKQTPLIELLERVPQDARLVVEHDQFSSSVHPVGRLCREAAAALRAALAEPQVWVCPEASNIRYAAPGHCEDCGKTLVQVAEPVQEPVAWAVYDIKHGGSKTLHWHEQHSPNGDSSQFKAVPLYSAPPQRKPLTEEEIERACVPLGAAMLSFTEVARAIERAHGIGGEP